MTLTHGRFTIIVTSDLKQFDHIIQLKSGSLYDAHMPHDESEMLVLHQIVRDAGKRVLELEQQGIDITIKSDQSQVTTADFEVDRILKEQLLSRYPNDGWLSEETPDDKQRLHKRRVWILDPIDGTRNFISKIPEYAISLALVDNHEPVLAVIFNPAKDEMFSAVKSKGAFLNDQPIHVKTAATDQTTCLISISPHQQKMLQALAPEITFQDFGSIAYALAIQASGQVDMTLNPGNQNEWDIAAGVLLVQEAGGLVQDRDGQPLCFNQPETTTRGVIATHSRIASTTQKLLNALD